MPVGICRMECYSGKRHWCVKYRIYLEISLLIRRQILIMQLSNRLFLYLREHQYYRE